MRARYFVAIICDESPQALDSLLFLVVRAQVQNLGHRAAFPGLDSYLGARLLLRQRDSVFRYGDAGNYEPLTFRIEVGIGIASTRAAYLEGLQPLLFEAELKSVD